MDQKSPKWKVLLPGEFPGVAPRWAVEGVWVLGQCLDLQKLSSGGGGGGWGGAGVVQSAEL